MLLSGLLFLPQIFAADAAPVKRGFLSYMKELLTYENTENENSENFSVKGVPFAFSYANSSSTGRHLLVGCTIYKRELGCLPALLDIFRAFKEGTLGSYAGRITFFLANPRAAGELNSNTASEPNTSFGLKSSHTIDKERADELKKLFTPDVQLFIDLSHRRSKIDKAFYSFPYEDVIFEWAQYLGASDTLVVPNQTTELEKEQQRAQHKEIMTMGEYARSRGIPALSFELLQKEKNDASEKFANELFFKVIKRAQLGLSRITSVREISELSYEPKLKEFYLTIHVEAFKGAKSKLNEGLQDFQILAKEQIIGSHDEGVAIKTPALDSLLLLNPKYPQRDEQGAAKEPYPPFLFKVIKKTKLEELQK